MKNDTFIIKSSLLFDYAKGRMKNYSLVFACFFSYLSQTNNKTTLTWSPDLWYETVYHDSSKRFKFDSTSEEYLTFIRKLNQSVDELEKLNLIQVNRCKKHILSIELKNLKIKTSTTNQLKRILTIDFNDLKRIITECDGLTKVVLPVFLTILYNISKDNEFISDEYKHKFTYISRRKIQHTINAVSFETVRRALYFLKHYHIIYIYSGGQFKKQTTKKERYENLYALYKDKQLAERFIRESRLTLKAEDC